MKYFKEAKQAKEVRDAQATKAVCDIILGVRQHGDNELRDLAKKFDNADLTNIRVTKEEIEKYKFDFENIINKDIKKRYSSILNPVTLIINGFKKVFDFPVLKKLLLLGFFISAMFIMYAVSTVCATLNIKDEDFVTYR